MSYSPPSIAALARLWTGEGGVNLGVVGNAAHTYGYHLGRDRIYGRGGQGARDYSVRTARDRAGLTDAAMALDLGRLHGSLTPLRAFSVWLVAQCRANRPGTSDIREVIYTPDGKSVYGWSREAGVASRPILGYGDSSHLTHTHISFYRDAERHDLAVAFRPYFATGAATVKSYAVPTAPSVGTVAKGKVIYTTDALDDNDPLRIIIDPARAMPYLGQPSAAVRIVEYVNEAGAHSGRAYFVHAADLTAIKAATAVPIPPDNSAAIEAATAPLRAEIAALQLEAAAAALQLEAATAAGAQAEHDRQAAGATVVVELLPMPEEAPDAG